MGQISYSSTIPGQKSIEEELGNPQKPEGLGTFVIPHNKKRDQNRTINSPVAASVGGNEVKPSFKVMDENYIFDPENIRRLRQMGFTPENILTYLELLKKQGPIKNSQEENLELAPQNNITKKNISSESLETEIQKTETIQQQRPKKTATDIIISRSKPVVISKSETYTASKTEPLLESTKAKIMRSLFAKKMSSNTHQPILRTEEKTLLQTTSTNTLSEQVVLTPKIKESTLESIVATEGISDEGSVVTTDLPKEAMGSVSIKTPSSNESFFEEEKNTDISPVPSRKDVAKIIKKEIPTEEKVLYREPIPEISGGVIDDVVTSEKIIKPLPITQGERDEIHTDLYAEKIQPEYMVTKTDTTTGLETSGVESSLKMKSSLEEKRLRKLIVDRLYTTNTISYGTDWRKYVCPPGTVYPHIKNNKEETTIPLGLSVEQIPSWRGSPEIKKIQYFVDDFIGQQNITEKELITKYVPSYVDPNNPSSSASVSGFSADEVLNGPEAVYGLMSDARLEISSLLKHLGTIDEATDYLQPTKKYSTGKFRTYQDYLATNPKITIHDYYDDIKRRVVEADKNEKK